MFEFIMGNTNITKHPAPEFLIYDSGDTSNFGVGGIALALWPHEWPVYQYYHHRHGPVGYLWQFDLVIYGDVHCPHPPTNAGIIVGGSFNVGGQIYNNIARLNTNGTLDTTFNPGTGADDIVETLGYQFNGQVVAGGVFTHVNGTPLNHLARFNVDGSLDTTGFFPGSGADDVVYNIDLQQFNGTMYIGGSFASYNGTHRLGFARLNFDGTLDTTFLDTAYNQFAGLKRIYSLDQPKVFGIRRPV